MNFGKSNLYNIPSTLSSKKHLKAPWINTHINRLSNRKKRAFNKACNTGLPSDWSVYRSIKKLCILAYQL